MSKYTNEWLFEQACNLDRDNESTAIARDKSGRRNPVELYTSGLRYDACGYISYDEYILIIDLLNGSRIIYDGYHHRFCEYVPGERITIDEEFEKSIFSKNLRRMMNDRRLTDDALSDNAQIGLRLICQYIEGTRIPTYDRLLRLCGALNCSVQDLTLPY